MLLDSVFLAAEGITVNWPSFSLLTCVINLSIIFFSLLGSCALMDFSFAVGTNRNIKTVFAMVSHLLLQMLTWLSFISVFQTQKCKTVF